MRLYPPVVLVRREVDKDTNLGGYFLPKGVSIEFSFMSECVSAMAHFPFFCFYHLRFGRWSPYGLFTMMKPIGKMPRHSSR